MESQHSNKIIGQTFAKIYRVVKKLGEGAFGEIYMCVNKQNQEELAIKLERADTQHPQIQFEAKLYSYLQGDGSNSYDKGIPRIHFFGQEFNYNFIVLDLLGLSLEDIFEQQQKRFTLKTVCMLADQMIQRIEYFHQRHFLHRDIKPDNFLMGIGNKLHKVFIIDYGLSKRYISKDGKHIPYRDGKSLTGTARYASINTHIGIEQSRRDDLESIGYVLLYFLRGILPWQNLKASNKDEKYKKIMEKKMQTSIENLCKGFPQQFVSYLNYCKNLRFEDKPDYIYLRSLFKEVMTNYRYEIDYQYDWTSSRNIKKIQLLQQSEDQKLAEEKEKLNEQNALQQTLQNSQLQNQLQLPLNSPVKDQQLQDNSNTNRNLSSQHLRNSTQLMMSTMQQKQFLIKRKSIQEKNNYNNNSNINTNSNNVLNNNQSSVKQETNIKLGNNTKYEYNIKQENNRYDNTQQFPPYLNNLSGLNNKAGHYYNSSSQNELNPQNKYSQIDNSRTNTLNSMQGRTLIQQRMVQDKKFQNMIIQPNYYQKRNINISSSVPLPKIINHKSKY